MNEEAASLEPSPDTGQREKRLEEKRNVTGKVSEICRFIGFGLLIIYWTAQFGETKLDLSGYGISSHRAIFLIGLSGGLAILADYIQYAAGAFAVKRALDNHPTYKYISNSWSYRARWLAYIVKQAMVFLGSMVVIYVVAT